MKTRKDFTPVSPIIIDDLTLTKFNDKIFVKSKLPKTIKDNVSTTLLKTVDKNKNVAIDMVLLMASMIINIYDEADDSIIKYQNIPKSRLEYYFGKNKYKKIMNILMRGTKTKEPFVECDEKYYVGEKSKGYRFTETYRKTKLIQYTLKTEKGRNIHQKMMMDNLSRAMRSPIAVKVIQSYSKVSLPSINELKERANELKDTRLKNGKILKSLGKHKIDYYTPGKYSFIEKDIEKFKLLTDGGFVIPIVTGDANGGRVIDSFTLMPSWIRAMIKLDGVYLSDNEYDFTCLHPNIALLLYGTDEEREILNGDIHTLISKHFDIDRQIVKIEHLSFFNKKIWQMKESILWDFYMDKAPVMMEQLIEEKQKNYKMTSQNLFTLEVDIMTEVIKRLDIDDTILYIYDAIHCNSDKIKDIMNDVAAEFGVMTYVK